MDELEVSKKFVLPKLPKIPKLPIKYILLVLLILVLGGIAVFLFFILKDKTSVTGPEYIDFVDSTGKITITVPSKFQFNTAEKDDQYQDLVLTSAISGSSIYISETTTNNIRDLFKYLDYEKNDFISKFSNISEVSDISYTTINDLEAYNYHFYYKDTMYVDVYFILKDSVLYVVDFDVNSESDSLKDSIEQIINSIQIS